MFLEKLVDGIKRALDLNQGIPPTYFIFQVEEYEEVEYAEEHGNQAHGSYQMDHPKDDSKPKHFQPLRFNPVVLPLFLEGPVRAFKMLSKGEARVLYQKIRESDLFDRKLSMYKVNASLDEQPQSIGRARAFPRGWLENESIWLHMEYKYLLEVLKAGLYDNFFNDLKTSLIPFLSPEMYKRSLLENSSFLVSSAHPDETIHGAGFVARLSGSTAEFLSIWNIMMAGEKPFNYDNGNLYFELKPILPGWLFPESGTISFKFLGRCTVSYHNPNRLDTYSGEIYPKRYKLQYMDSQSVDIEQRILGTPFAEDIRDGRITQIDVFF